jgi:hypothetical protein
MVTAEVWSAYRFTIRKSSSIGAARNTSTDERDLIWQPIRWLHGEHHHIASLSYSFIEPPS